MTMSRTPMATGLAALLTIAIAASAMAAPRQHGDGAEQVGARPTTLVEARKFLEGRWSLESFEIRPPDGALQKLKGSGVLTFDDFANLRMEIRTDQGSADTLRAAGIEVRDGLISTDGRVAIDLQRRALTYFLEGQRSGYVTGGGPLAPSRPRYWEVTADTLTLTTRDDKGAPMSISRWTRRQ